MITENLRIAMIGLSSNRLRATLTMLGIIIGVAAVVSLLSVGQAFERFLISEFTSVGTNLIIVLNDTDSGGEAFSNTEYNLLTNRIYAPDVEHVVPIVPAGVNAVYGGSDLSIGVTGVTPEYIQAISSEILEGRMFSETEVENRARVTVISVDVAERLFSDGETPVGESIRLGSVSFQVIGVLRSETGENGPGAQSDYTVLAPYTTVQTRLVGGNARTTSGEASITNFIITSVDSDSANDAFEQVRAVLRIS
ncbi:MAG: ABC transporter permease, partial [Chloroflexota bacterium]